MSASIGLQLIILRLGLLENWKSAILGRLWELLGSTSVHPLVLGLQVYTTMLNFLLSRECWGFKFSPLSLWNEHLYLFIWKSSGLCVYHNNPIFRTFVSSPKSPGAHFLGLLPSVLSYQPFVLCRGD